jgi:hypothetical protein
MALLYPWATKDYLLWEMSLAQIILYHNIGFELKYPKPEKNQYDARNLSPEELKKVRDELRNQYGEIGGDHG